MSDLDKLKKVIERNYYTIRKRFPINKKYKISANSMTIEDTFHNLLERVLIRAANGDFKYIDESHCLNFIYKTFHYKKRDMLQNNNVNEEEQEDKVDLFLYISEQYDRDKIDKSIFKKLFDGINSN